MNGALQDCADVLAEAGFSTRPADIPADGGRGVRGTRV